MSYVFSRSSVLVGWLVVSWLLGGQSDGDQSSENDKLKVKRRMSDLIYSFFFSGLHFVRKNEKYKVIEKNHWKEYTMPYFSHFYSIEGWSSGLECSTCRLIIFKGLTSVLLYGRLAVTGNTYWVYRKVETRRNPTHFPLNTTRPVEIFPKPLRGCSCYCFPPRLAHHTLQLSQLARPFTF